MSDKLQNDANDTIVAIATAPANGAVGILRLSGPFALKALKRLFFSFQGEPLNEIKPRYFYFGQIKSVVSNEVLDEACAVYMKAPHSFTGEDVVELHCHGNLFLMRRLLAEILSFADLGVRAAGPGEFSKRAYLNGKMDLTQAEAVHSLITAESYAQVQASLSNLDGRLKNIVGSLTDSLRASLALVEASFEFPEEDIQTFDRDEVFCLLKESQESLERLLLSTQTAKFLDKGISVALVGAPNVGKSSLLNALLVEKRAIVTDIAGTTRDVIEGAKFIDGVRFIFRDTAGLRETEDVVEKEGIKKSREWIQNSDIVFFITDQLETQQKLEFRENQIVYSVLNKVDLLTEEEKEKAKNFSLDFLVSAQTGEGLSHVEETLRAFLDKNNVQNSIHINERQARALRDGLNIINNINRLNKSFEITEEVLAEELRSLIACLEEITGEITNEDVLGEIFQRFCIGK